jgi:hypothetical protein
MSGEVIGDGAQFGLATGQKADIIGPDQTLAIVAQIEGWGKQVQVDFCAGCGILWP